MSKPEGASGLVLEHTTPSPRAPGSSPTTGSLGGTTKDGTDLTSQPGSRLSMGGQKEFYCSEFDCSIWLLLFLKFYFFYLFLPFFGLYYSRPLHNFLIFCAKCFCSLSFSVELFRLRIWISSWRRNLGIIIIIIARVRVIITENNKVQKRVEKVEKVEFQKK